MAKIFIFCGPVVTEQWIQGECQDPRNPCAPCTVDHIHMADAVWYVCMHICYIRYVYMCVCGQVTAIWYGVRYSEYTEREVRSRAV